MRARRTLVLAYALGLTLIAALSSAIWLSTIVLISAQERVAAEVNIAGRQRMLTQRIAMIAGNVEDWRQISEVPVDTLLLGCADLMESAHVALLSRKVEAQQASASQGVTCDRVEVVDLPMGALGADLQETIFGGTPSLNDEIYEFLAMARAFVASGLTDLSIVHDMDELAYKELPSRLDQTVQALQREGEAAIADLRLYKTLMWLATLLLLVGEVFVIFRPMTKTVREAVIELEDTVDRLAAREKDLKSANAMIMESIQYARRIQENILPNPHALDDTVAEIEMIWEPLQVVSGDYVWVERRQDIVILFLGDCTGHGVPGAFMTMVVAAALERILDGNDLSNPGDVLLRLDREVRSRLRQDVRDSAGDDLGSDDGLEAALCFYNQRTGELAYSGAGIPLLVSGSDGVIETKADRSLLGYRDLRVPETFTVHRREIAAGEALYLFSDGVPDHVGGTPARTFGRKRFRQAIEHTASMPLDRQMKSVRATLDAFRGDEPKRDDVTLLAVRPRAALDQQTQQSELTVKYAGT